MKVTATRSVPPSHTVNRSSTTFSLASRRRTFEEAFGRLPVWQRRGPHIGNPFDQTQDRLPCLSISFAVDFATGVHRREHPN
jgi:hypothetical protein